MGKKKKAIKEMVIILIICFLLFPFAGATGQEALESDRIKTLESLKKLDDFPLYMMRFYGDYEIPEYAAGGTIPQDLQIENQPDNSALWACTCFSVQGEDGHPLLGRNFDWQNHPALLLFTDPPDRYASVSMVDISYLGYSKSDNPEKNPGGLFESPLIPFDGMNEQGLAIGMMALSAADAPQDPQKQTVGNLLIIRLMLDYAKDVEEAVDVIENFNIDFRGGPPLHYFLTDRSGRSVVVEFVNRNISVLPNTRSWQVSTNFVLTGLSSENARASCWRYQKVWDTLENQIDPFSSSNALSLLIDVSQPNTIWSAVYDTASLNILVVMGKKYDRIHEFNLK
jgi:predicted choloylglycine hydrolase